MKLYTFDEFYHKEFDTPLWLMEPYIQSCSDMLVNGKFGSGKTALAITLGKAIAQGGEFLNKWQCDQGTVVFLQIERPQNWFQERIHHLDQMLGTPNFHIMTDDRNQINIQTEVETKAQWIEDLKALEPAFIIIDSVRAAHRWNENDNDIPRVFFDWWREATGYTSTNCFIHHNKKSPMFFNKGTGKMEQAAETDEDARGAIAWLDAAATVIRVDKGNRGPKAMQYSKLSSSGYPDPVPIFMDDESLLIVNGEGSPAERYVRQAMTQGRSKAEIVAVATNKRREIHEFKQPLGKTKVYEMLEGYVK